MESFFLFLVTYWLLTLVLAIMPWAIASIRNHNDTVLCGVLGIFLAPTIFGWCIVFIWALYGETEKQYIQRLQHKHKE